MTRVLAPPADEVELLEPEDWQPAKVRPSAKVAPRGIKGEWEKESRIELTAGDALPRLKVSTMPVVGCGAPPPSVLDDGSAHDCP